MNFICRDVQMNRVSQREGDRERVRGGKGKERLTDRQFDLAAGFPGGSQTKHTKRG